MSAMTAGTLGFIDTPLQYNPRPDGAAWCADNGCFSKRWKADHWWKFLLSRAHAAESCLFAVAPDVVGDAAATLEKSLPWMPKMRALGYRVAFVAQDGLESIEIPWGEFDVLFVGGSTEFKLGDVARSAVTEARSRGKGAHMGRVNSGKRYQYAESIGCTSVDGTFLTYAPDHNLGRMLRWFQLPKLSPPQEGLPL